LEQETVTSTGTSRGWLRFVGRPKNRGLFPVTAQRLRLAVRGAVQGVGFRPFVYRLAEELGLGGFVANDVSGVTLEVEGGPDRVLAFMERLVKDCPPLATPEIVERVFIQPVGQIEFEIRPSQTGGAKRAVVLPDVATCPDCLRELSSPADRRYRYPFINCTHCGPRFSIVLELPYDRPNTTMRAFLLCPACHAEYHDPKDRRFHAQPNACPACGPRLSLWNAEHQLLGEGDRALLAAAQAVRDGRILALKGLGGFHLVVDSRNQAAVEELRRRKARWEKPLALMAPNLEAAHQLCDVSTRAERLLTRPEAPIVLMRRHPGTAVAEAVAPGNPYLGVMLPYTPVHHLLLGELGFTVVATSGNAADEPICIDNSEAQERLARIADLWLLHDRPIVRQVDDSVMMPFGSHAQLVRRSRGYAPRPVRSPRELPGVLALGPELKSTIALGFGREVFLSQHVGDLGTAEALSAHTRIVRDFLRMYAVRPRVVAHDLHPDYQATAWIRELFADAARQGGWPEEWEAFQQAELVGVQHHHAHLVACLADNLAEGPALGLTWDGTGYGPDGTVWGGEGLVGDASGYRRLAHLRVFRLPGSEASVREPRRSLLGVLWEIGLETAAAPHFSDHELGLLVTLLQKRVNAPLTTSAGRLFDAVAALLGLRATASFEGQAAMELEYVADPAVSEAYPFPLEPPEHPAEPYVLDWEPLLRALLEDHRRGSEPGVMSARFHNALVEGMVRVAEVAGERRVALSGGCFQNRLLVERARERLTRAGYDVLLHQNVPPNDGGVSLGQVMIGAASLAEKC
jgi:hydrogenase maturation protein HypF